MANQVANGAVCMCPFGAAPGTLVVPPAARVMACGLPAAAITDISVTPFGMCSNPANPVVAANIKVVPGGVIIVPQPCVPAITGTWVPGSPTVLIGGKPALNNTCKLMCAYGGVIQINAPMAMTVMVP